MAETNRSSSYNKWETNEYGRKYKVSKKISPGKRYYELANGSVSWDPPPPPQMDTYNVTVICPNNGSCKATNVKKVTTNIARTARRKRNQRKTRSNRK